MNNFTTYCKKAAIAGLVSILLWGVSAPAYAANANDYYTNERGSVQSTERYDQIQAEQGGMNNFDDVDPRRNTKEATAKAKALSDNAERNISRSSDVDPLESVREAVDNAGDKLSQTADNVTDSIGNQADKAAARLDRGVERATNRVQR